MWLQILAFIVSMTGTVMLLYRDPDISPQIWNCSLVLASVAAAAIFKVSVYRTSPHERFCRLRRFWSVLALSVTAETHEPTLAADICRVVLARVFRLYTNCRVVTLQVVFRLFFNQCSSCQTAFCLAVLGQFHYFHGFSASYSTFVIYKPRR